MAKSFFLDQGITALDYLNEEWMTFFDLKKKLEKDHGDFGNASLIQHLSYLLGAEKISMSRDQSAKNFTTSSFRKNGGLSLQAKYQPPFTPIRSQNYLDVPRKGSDDFRKFVKT